MQTKQEPSLVILAAGMGSRFGGLKQITPVDEHGHAIIDFSLFDAHRAGFRKVIFVIKDEISEDFKAFIGRRMEKYFDVRYAYQQLSALPEGYSVPEGRSKPWGTAQAVLSAAGEIDGPFAVINADDFYGCGAYKAMYDFLKHNEDDTCSAMVGYKLINTVTENGSVARGICQVEDGCLTGVTERIKIFKRGEDAEYTEDDVNFFPLSGQCTVSMNFWGFPAAVLDKFRSLFPAWLDKNLKTAPLKAEYFLPYVVNSIIESGEGKVRVLDCHEVWTGVTYREDLENVKAYIASLRRDGLYPETMLD